MALLSAVIALRSVAWFTLLAFVPLWIVGLAIGIGGVAAAVLAAVADAVYLKTALTISALAPALGIIACLRLPAPAKQAEILADPCPPLPLGTTAQPKRRECSAIAGQRLSVEP